MARKKFEQLNLQDAFLFSAALEDPETCRLILELFLGYPINNITVHAEHSILHFQVIPHLYLVAGIDIQPDAFEIRGEQNAVFRMYGYIVNRIS